MSDSTTEPTARETNLEIAHKGLVNAKYALYALAHDRTLNEKERANHESDARIVDALVTRVCLQRLDDVAEAGDMGTSDGLGA